MAIDVLQFFVWSMINPVINLINSVINVGNVMGQLVSVFSGTFPSTWIVLMGIIIMVNVAFRIYYFARNIQIAGFSI